MRIATSILTGFFLAPLLALLRRLLLEAEAPPSFANVLLLVVLGVVTAIAAAFRPARGSRGQRALGSALVLLGVLGLVFGAGTVSERGAVAVGGIAVVIALGLRACGGTPPRPGELLIGLALGMAVDEFFLLPSVGFPFLAPVAASCLLITRALAAREVLSPAHAEPDDAAPWTDAIACGVLMGAVFHLARPFVMQQLSGTRFSHEAVVLVPLFGAGLGALIPIGGPRWLRRSIPALLALGAIWLTLFVILRYGASTSRMLQIAFARSDDARLQELSAVRVLLGLAALTAGIWMRAVLGATPSARRVAAFLLAIACGGAISGIILRDASRWPESVLGPQGALVLGGPLEIHVDHLVTEGGVLRVARNMTQSEGAPHLLWQGRRATRTPSFKAMEAQEVLLADTGAEPGGSLLIVGNPASAHRDALGGTSFKDYVVLPTLPIFESESLEGETREDLHALRRSSRRFRAITVLSSPTLSEEAARPLTLEAITTWRELLDPAGSLVVSLDLRAVPLDAVGAVARAIRDVFGELRVWLCADGLNGPFVLVQAGHLRAPDENAFRVRIPPEVFLEDGGTRVDRIADPVAETRRPTVLADPILAPAERLHALARRLHERAREKDLLAVAHVVESLAVHSAAYFDVESQNAKFERNRLMPEQADALVAALETAPDVPFVKSEIRAYLVLAYAKGNYEMLDRVLLPALAHAPDDRDLLLLSGRANHDLLDDEDAVADLEKAVSLGDPSFETYLVLGQSYDRLDDHAAAISALTSALDLAPNEGRVLKSLARALIHADRKDEARPYLDRVLADAPTDKEARGLMAELGGPLPDIGEDDDGVLHDGGH